MVKERKNGNEGKGEVRDWDKGRGVGKHRDKDGGMDLEERKKQFLYTQIV